MRDDTIKLKSGKEVYANRGLVSIGKSDYESYKESNQWVIGEGYDGEIDLSEWSESKNDYDAAFTKEELMELGYMMIQRWTEFMSDIEMGKVIIKNE